MGNFRLDTIHSGLVHFPIALLIVAFLLEILARYWKSAELSRAAVWNLIFGALGAVVAAISGLINSNMVHHTDAGHELMELHEKLGLWVAVGALLLLSIRVSPPSTYLGKLKPAYLVILALLVGLLTYTGHIGGRMVFDEGVAVNCIPMGTHEHGESEEGMPQDLAAKDSICINEFHQLMEKAMQAGQMPHESAADGDMTMPMGSADHPHDADHDHGN